MTSSAYFITVQYASQSPFVPSALMLKHWAKTVLSKHRDAGELVLRLVDSAEMSGLNAQYRHKQGPTNVLSFPLVVPSDISLLCPLLGDIVLCIDVINQEAQEKNVTQKAHWAHMVVHGICHLLGHDHQTDHEAQKMEALETKMMALLGFPSPYETENIRT